MERAVPGLRFDVTRELAAEAKIGISQMDWALANTGTLVQNADAVDKRLVSTLPLLHIALVSTAALLPDLPAVFEPRRSPQLGLSLLHYRTQPHGRHRAGTDHRRARPRAAHHRAGGRPGGGGMNKEFKESIHDALDNPNLTGALGRFSEAYRVEPRQGL